MITSTPQEPLCPSWATWPNHHIRRDDDVAPGSPLLARARVRVGQSRKERHHVGDGRGRAGRRTVAVLWG